MFTARAITGQVKTTLNSFYDNSKVRLSLLPRGKSFFMAFLMTLQRKNPVYNCKGDLNYKFHTVVFEDSIFVVNPVLQNVFISLCS